MSDNGDQLEIVQLPRSLVQAILDVLVRLPAGDVYPILRALDQQLGISTPAPAETSQ